ncbi:MAG: hypothetical protein ABW096_14205 [Candidatus Thiodiazotropha sp.]
MVNTHERSFEREVTLQATQISSSDLDEYISTLSNKENSREKRLFAYCVIFTYYRRQKEINKCIDLYEQFKREFGDEFIVMHLLSVAVKESGRRKDLVKSIKLARHALTLQQRHVGVLHNLAGALFRLAEEDGIKKASSRKLLQEARDSVEEAIDIESDYPKFHATKAEILSALGDYKGGLNEIYKAIDGEDSRSSDYPLRISEYMARKQKIELRKSISEVTDESRRELAAAMSEARRSNLEILSFFVAVVSFVIAGINIAVKFTLQDAVHLIFVLSASMLLTVSGFILLYDSDRRFTRFLQAFAVGLVVLLISFGVRFLPIYSS